MPRRLAATAVLLACVAPSACSSKPAATATGADVVSTTGAPPVTESSVAPPTTEEVTTTATDAPTTDSTAPSSDTLTWAAFGTAGVETSDLEVPLDYSDPSKGTVNLYIARHKAPAATRIGSLLVNPGGPGAGGSDFAVYADQIYSQKLLDHFDIVGWDPRGTGLSTPAIDCISDYDHMFTGTDITPDTPAARQQLVDLAKEFSDDCVKKDGAFIGYMGTNNTARDMDSIRRALGEAKISYFGFSYGSELGGVWTTMFPDTVRAAVLDGASDPTADFNTEGLQQAKGFEGTIATFLKQCSATATCVFHNGGNAEKAFDDLMVSIDGHPLPTESGRPDLTRAMALTGVAMAMYDQQYWPQLEQALADAQKGDGAGLLTLFDMYYQRRGDGTWDNMLEAFQVITCMDTSERPTVEQDDATAAGFAAAAPRFSPGTTGTYFCTFFPKAIDPRVAITGDGAGPILVMGTTGDPATPLSSTENMAKALQDGRLVIVTADQHTGYGVNQCSYDVIDNYLIDPVNDVPANGTRCD